MVRFRLFRRFVMLVFAFLVGSFAISSVGNVAGAVPQIFSVTYWPNNPGNQMPTTSQSSSSAAFLQPFSTMGLSYSNYIFEDWNTQPNGGGITYGDMAPYSFAIDTDLYAQWTQVTHAVTFYANRSIGDAVFQNEAGNTPMNLTSIAKIGFSNQNHTFIGWNTEANGSGVFFDDQATYSFVADLSLYAQWTINNETVLFSPNTGVGTVPQMTTPFGSSISLPIGSNLTKSNYSFGGWNTMPDGSGTFYPPGAVISVQTSQTLYASWARNTFVVSFLIPGVKGKVAPISVPAGGAIALRSSSKLVNPGFTFSGWYTAPVGGEFVGDGGATYEPTRSMALYAHWKGNQNVNLEFSDNGGVGHVKARTIHQGLGVIIPDGSLLHRPGYAFRGWASNPRASVPSVRIGAKFVLTRTKILYALWRRDVPASTPQVLLGSVGMFAPNSSSLTATMRRFIASLAADINRRDRTQVLLYGYATSVDSVHGSGLLSLKRAIAVKNQLNDDLAGLNDVGVTLRASGEGRLSNSVLASFRNVEVFAN